MVKATGFAAAAAAAFAGIAQAGMQSPPFPASAFFNRPAGNPPVKTPRFVFTSPETGAPIQYYQMDMKPLTRNQYPNLGPTRMLGYDGNMPGPTFRMTKGIEAVVRFVNHADRACSIHLHGSFSRSPFDGYADDTTPVGWYKDYYYPNRQNARTLWYHDHAVDHTAENVYFGLAGFYVLRDPQDPLSESMPQDQYDVPLGIMARRYNTDGTLWDPEANNELTSVFGDVIEVNGIPWPYMKVEPRKYRFRFLDMGISRTYILFLQADQQNNKGINFTMIGADTGLLAQSVSTSTLTMSIAERWEAIVDFAPYAGQNVTMHNQRGVGADSDFDNTDKVLRFIVGTTVTSQQGNGAIPTKLRDVPFPPANEVQATRHFLFHHSGNWLINGIGWNDGLPARLLASPQRGSVEVWQLQNGGGGWTHPIHIHLIDFQVIARTGNRGVLPYEAAAEQDVVWLGTGETVTVIARYAPWPGRYMVHCHNLIHEDHEMLGEFNVTQVAGLGLNEIELFTDPLEHQYRSVGPFNEADFQAGTGNFSQASIQAKVFFFTAKKAYQDADHVESVLEAFWAAKVAKEKRDGKYEHYDMPAMERRDRLQGWWKPKEGPKIKGRSPKAAPEPTVVGAHLGLLSYDTKH